MRDIDAAADEVPVMRAERDPELLTVILRLTPVEQESEIDIVGDFVVDTEGVSPPAEGDTPDPVGVTDGDTDDTFVREDRGVLDEPALGEAIDAVGVDVTHALKVGVALRRALSLAAGEKLNVTLPLPVSEAIVLCELTTVSEDSIVD